MTRGDVLAILAEYIAAIERPHPVRIGIDGAAATGKTTMADELVAPIEARGRRVIRARGDDFHNPKSVRYQKGRESFRGYYLDAFDSQSLVRQLLEPLGPEGSGRYRNALHDLESDRPLEQPFRQAGPSDILLLDGMFLQRRATRAYFEMLIYLETETEVARTRAIARDAPLLGGPDAVARIYERRYDPAQRLYVTEVRPGAGADAVIDNTRPGAPELVRMPSNPTRAKSERPW